MTGAICGSVFNENGTPASAVRVVAMIQGSGGHSGGYPWAYTDASGHYCFNGLAFGLYVFSADDEKKGYPQRGPAFYTWSSPAPEAALTAMHPHAALDWQIPFKAAFLRIHVSADQLTAQVTPIAFDLVVLSRPKLGIDSLVKPLQMAAEGPTTVLLPPGEEVALTATSPGYRQWPGPGEEHLNLRSGETKDITIRLATAAP